MVVNDFRGINPSTLPLVTGFVKFTTVWTTSCKSRCQRPPNGFSVEVVNIGVIRVLTTEKTTFLKNNNNDDSFIGGKQTEIQVKRKNEKTTIPTTFYNRRRWLGGCFPPPGGCVFANMSISPYLCVESL